MASFEDIEAEQARRDARRLAETLEELADPAWPAWPPQADGDYHRWVQKHWTVEAADAFDALDIAARDLVYADLRVLADEVVDFAEDLGQIRARIAQDGWPLWPAGLGADWRQWLKENWPGSWVATFLRDLEGAQASLGWVGDHRQRLRVMNERERDRLRALIADMPDQERARLLKDLCR
jgi:hypothetical protein